METIIFPRDKDKYALELAAVTKTDAACIYKAKAKCENLTTGEMVEIPVGIKIINVRKTEDIYAISTEVCEARMCHHENMVKVHCSFKNGNEELWIVMAPLSVVSLRSVIRSSYPHGLPEKKAAFVLKETLKALECMHGKNMLHENIGADCIFMDVNSSAIKLAPHSLKYEIHDAKSEYPDWMMAPEFQMNRKQGHSEATDVWMFGVLALELFYGHVPADDFREFQLLVKRIENSFGPLRKKKQANKGVRVRDASSLFSCLNPRGKMIPRPLGEVLGACLCEDQSKRATASQLLELDLFRNCSEGAESLVKLQKAFFKH